MGKIKNLNFKLLFGNLILIIGIIMFVTLFSRLFGAENTLFGVGVITAVLMCGVIDLNIPVKNSCISIFMFLIGMVFSNYLSGLNSLYGVVINFVTVFFIIYMVTNRMNTKTFLPFILCYIFLSSDPVTIEKLPIRIVAAITGGSIFALVYYLKHKNDKKFLYNNLLEQLLAIRADSLQFNFAIRMALGISVAIFVGRYFSFEKSMLWISITVMSLTQPYIHQTKRRIKHRVLGTIVGIVIFVMVFNFLIPKNFSSYALLFLSYIYTFIKEYKVQIVFITMNSLGASAVLNDISVLVPMRINFILAGTIIAFIINRVFYNKQAVVKAQSCAIKTK